MAIMKRCRYLQAKQAEDTVDRIAYFIIMRRIRGFQIIEKEILSYSWKANFWKLRDQKLSELVMRMAWKVGTIGTEHIIVEQSKSTSRPDATQDGAVAIKVLVIHEVHLVLIKERPTQKLKFQLAAYAKNKAMFKPCGQVIKINIAA